MSVVSAVIPVQVHVYSFFCLSVKCKKICKLFCILFSFQLIIQLCIIFFILTDYQIVPTTRNYNNNYSKTIKYIKDHFHIKKILYCYSIYTRRLSIKYFALKEETMCIACIIEQKLSNGPFTLYRTRARTRDLPWVDISWRFPWCRMYSQWLLSKRLPCDKPQSVPYTRRCLLLQWNHVWRPRSTR